MRLAALCTFVASVLLHAGAALAGPPVPVPEPSSLALASLGIGAVAVVKFWRRR